MTSEIRNFHLILSFLVNFSRRYGLLTQAGAFGGDGALKKSAAD